MWMCTLSLAVAIGAVLLLPFSIMSNEILLLYPDNWYMQWLSSALVHSLWNHVFLMSNVCMFILLPFAYFFIESQGFRGVKKGIWARVYEATALCILLIVVLCCVTNVVAVLLNEQHSTRLALLNIWNYQLPFIYSCMSLFGVCMLTFCTPLGLGRMFSEVSDYVVKPQLVSDIENDLALTTIQELTLKRKIDSQRVPQAEASVPVVMGAYHQVHCYARTFSHSQSQSNVNNEPSAGLHKQLLHLHNVKVELERQKRSLRWLSNLKYPLVMLVLLALTCLTVLLVVNNILQLVFGLRSLPSYQQYMHLGKQSSSALGIVGSITEIFVIFYVISASLVGMYRLPILRMMRPRHGRTSICTFDLLGNYGRIDWLGHFYLVLGYNVVFALSVAINLITKFTTSVRKALLLRLNEAASTASASCSGTSSIKADNKHNQ